MRSQHPGMSQPRPNQQQGSNDRQLWQQHLMFKQLQLQEMQRQRQLQQPNLGGRQQNTLSQLSDVAHQPGIGHSTPVLSGMPINNASEYTSSSGHMGGEPRAMNNSFMFNTGNMSWAQHAGHPMHGISNGLVFSPDQGQTMRPIGFVQQHDEQSLYGTPVPNTRYSPNNYPQSQGMSHDRTGVMKNKGGGGNSQEKASMQPSASNYFQNDQCVIPEHDRVQNSDSVTKQGFQGNSLFGSAPVHGLNSGSMLGNFQQMNHFMQSVQAQEFQGGQERDNWCGRLQENKMPVVGPSRSVANLDPTEEKLLLSTDNDCNWSGSFGYDNSKNTGSNVNPVQNSDHNSAFPSIQSGSWSALMLDALDASSSDTGLQEEWSGLMKTEPSNQNHYAILSPNEKQQLSWDEKNLSLTSRTLPLFNDADAGPNHHAFSSFQQSSSKFAYEHNEKAAAGVSHESSQQSSKEAKNKQFDHNLQQKQFVRSSLQDQTSFDNVSNGAWAGQVHRHLVNTRHSENKESDMPMRNGNSLSSDKSNGWNVNRSSIGENTSNIHDNDDTKGHAQWDTIKKKEPVNSKIGSPKMHGKNANTDDYAAATYSSALEFNQEMKQHASDQHWLGSGKHVARGSSLHYQGTESVPTYQDQLSRDQQYRYASLTSTDKKEASEISGHKRESINPGDVPNENCIPNHSHSTKHADCESGPRENSLSTGNDPGPFFHMSQKSLGQIGQNDSGPNRFQYHMMGNLEMDLGPAASRNGTLYSQDPNQSLVQGTKTQEHGYIGRSETANHGFPPSSMDFGKELDDSQRNTEVADRIYSGGTAPSHDPVFSSYDGLATNVSQNIRAGQASHNMLELLHKVDQSRNSNNVTHFSFSDHNGPSELPKDFASDGSTSLQHDNSSALQGFGLKLGPPSQWQPVSDNDLASQTSLQKTNEFGPRNIVSGREDKDRAGSSSTISVPPPHLLAKVPPGKFNNRSNIYGLVNKQTPYSGINGNPLTFSNSTHPYSREEPGVQQQQRQQRVHVPSITRSPLSDQSANLSVRGQVNIDDHAKQSPQRRQTQHSNVGNASDQSAQGSLPSGASRIPLSRLNPSRDTCAPAVPQFHSLNSGPTQPIYSSSLLVSSGQQFPVAETRPAAPPATSGMSEQGGFSSMVHKVRSSLSAQQHLSIIEAQNTGSKLPQSTDSSRNRMDTSSWARKADQYNKVGGGAPSESGTCSTNSQQLIHAEEYPVKGQSSQHIPTERLDGALETGGASQGQEPVSISSLVHLHHKQDQNRGKHAFDSSLDTQNEHVLNSNVHRPNYSLLHQMQAMSDPSGRAGKRLKGESFGADAPQVELAADQKFIYGQNTVARLDAAPQQSSFPSDVKMLSFSRENKDVSVDTSSQLTSGEKSSKVSLTSRTNNLQNHTHFLNKFSTLAFMRENGQPQITSQMAPSWFDLYKSYKNGQVIATDVEPDNSQSSTKATAIEVEPGSSHSQHHSYAKVSESMNNSALIEHKYDAAQIGVLPQSTLSTDLAAKKNSFVQSPPSNVIDNNLVLLPKKRKTATSELLPWHKKLTEGSGRLLLNTSTSQLDWAKAANRMIEKAEEEPEMIEDRSSRSRPRKRLTLTTQLMYQLLPAVPATILRADAVTSHESVTYSVAKLALGDACSLISFSGNDSLHSNSGNTTSEKLMSSEKARHHFLSKATESFIGRTRQLESDLSRLENKDPMLDVGLECQDLDRCSTINRLAKFHGRAQANGNEGTSTPETVPCRIFPQRNVIAHAVTTDLPNDVCYLSL